jgi:hypothetical protein
MTMGGVESTAHELEAQAHALAVLDTRPQAAEATAPEAAFASASSLLRAIEIASVRAIRDFQRQPLRRATAIAALVCARAARLRAASAAHWLSLAEAQATAARDTPLQALVRLERATAAGQAARSADLPSAATVQHATAALHEAGSGHGQAGIRAAARFHLAWELAATGDQRSALMELDAGRVDAQRADWDDPAIAACAGSALGRLGRLKDAVLALSGALDSPPSRRTWVLCDLARTYVAMGDVDMGAEALEEAFLLATADGLTARLPRVIAARSLLPAGRALRELDDVLGSAWVDDPGG